MKNSGRGGGILAELGVTPVINGGGPNTMHSGSRPLPEVVEAMEAMAPVFVQMDEWLIAAGREIAQLIGAPAATVTSGASGGLVVQTAAAISRGDPELIAQLPLTDGLPNELIIQKTQRFGYDHLYLVAGARFVEVGDQNGCTPEQVEAAITDNTAAIIDLESGPRKPGDVPLTTLVEIAHRHGLPVLCDGASKLPPRANLKRFLDEGADLVSFSGGKGVRGPQSTGILLGLPEWIEYARLCNAPNATVARGLKVSKEEIAGLVAAVRTFVAVDETAESAAYTRAMQVIVDEVGDVPGVDSSVRHDEAYYIPHAVFRFNDSWIGPDNREIGRRMLAGDPRVYMRHVDPGGLEVSVDPLNIQEGEHGLVARILREMLTLAAKGK